MKFFDYPLFVIIYSNVILSLTQNLIKYLNAKY